MYEKVWVEGGVCICFCVQVFPRLFYGTAIKHLLPVRSFNFKYWYCLKSLIIILNSLRNSSVKTFCLKFVCGTMLPQLRGEPSMFLESVFASPWWEKRHQKCFHCSRGTSHSTVHSSLEGKLLHSRWPSSTPGLDTIASKSASSLKVDGNEK